MKSSESLDNEVVVSYRTSGRQAAVHNHDDGDDGGEEEEDRTGQRQEEDQGDDLETPIGCEALLWRWERGSTSGKLRWLGWLVMFLG